MTQELKQENKVEMPVVKVGRLEINSYDYLSSVRIDEVAKLKKIEKTRENYKALKDGKNSLVKKRTEIAKFVKADCKVIDEVKNLIKLKGQDLIDITEPTEKDLAEFVDAIDNEEKLKIEAEQKRVEECKLAIADWEQKKYQEINKLKKSDDLFDCNIPEQWDFKEEFTEAITAVSEKLASHYKSKMTELKEREDFELEKTKLAEEKAKLEAEKAKLSEVKVKEEFEPEIEDLPEIDDLPELEDIIETKEEATEEAEVEELLDELDGLLEDDNDKEIEPEKPKAKMPILEDAPPPAKPKQPTLSEIYKHLYKTYPQLHSDRYFQALKNYTGE